MKRIFLLNIIFLCSSCVFAQQKIVINEAGLKLKAFYLKQNVTGLWISGHHINWQTGEPDMPNAVKSIKTHCSAFVASVCEQLNIYILRPPEHVQGLLANAQYNWLFSVPAYKMGWRQISENKLLNAQQYADNGLVVVAVAKNPERSKPGHIALVLPSIQDSSTLQNKGPVLIQASIINADSIPFRRAFARHISDWPQFTDEVVFFYNIHASFNK